MMTKHQFCTVHLTKDYTERSDLISGPYSYSRTVDKSRS